VPKPSPVMVTTPTPPTPTPIKTTPPKPTPSTTTGGADGAAVKVDTGASSFDASPGEKVERGGTSSIDSEISTSTGCADTSGDCGLSTGRTTSLDGEISTGGTVSLDGEISTGGTVSLDGEISTGRTADLEPGSNSFDISPSKVDTFAGAEFGMEDATSFSI